MGAIAAAVRPVMPLQDDRPSLDHPDDDPRLWLEEIEGERALDWVTAQSAATLARFGGPSYERDREALLAIFDRPDKIPHVGRRGAFVYNFWQDADHPRGVWRRTTLASYRLPQPAWDVLLDLDSLAKIEGEDWVWAGAGVEPEDRQRAMLRLSRGGSDAVVLREFDLDARAFLTGGFVLDQAKGGVAWVDRDTLLLSSAWGDGMATRSGYARSVRLWRRGTPPQDAGVIFTVGPDSMSAWGSVDRTAKPPRLWFFDKPSFFDTIGWLDVSDGPNLRVDLPTDVWWEVHADSLVVKPRTPWTVGGQSYAPDMLLGLSWSAFLAGERHFTVLFNPGERRVLEGFFWTGGRLVVSILDDLAPRFAVFDPETWIGRPIEGLPDIGVVSLHSIDHDVEDNNGEVVVGTQDPLTPQNLLLLDVTRPTAPAVLKANAPMFDAAGLVISRHEAILTDGERIPYTMVGPRSLDGHAPVHLSGYGGFAVSNLPVYRASVGKLWLERGGTSVVANIRGGGEFGTRWHEAGRLAGKRLSHDDFAAVASDLVRRGVTRPKRIAAEGGSNGGLLIANMLTRYPERFGALLCTIPLIDMRRYAKLLAGASWIAEYGDPDKPEDWAFLGPMSAYQAAEPGRPYPPILLATTRRDDRVHPGHARKMALKLQDMGYPAHLFEPAAGGHSYGKDNAERAAFIALGFSFLRDAIGWAG